MSTGRDFICSPEDRTELENRESMIPKASRSAIIPWVLLLAGLTLAVFLVARNIVELNRERPVFAAQELDYKRETVAHEQCAAQIRKSGGYGDLVDLVIDGRCPPKPVDGDPAASFAHNAKTSRAIALGTATLVAVLSSLPWLASRWTRARIRPPIQA